MRLNPVWDLLAETYYQRLDKLVVFTDGTDFVATNDGEGTSYGVDPFVPEARIVTVCPHVEAARRLVERARGSRESKSRRQVPVDRESRCNQAGRRVSLSIAVTRSSPGASAAGISCAVARTDMQARQTLPVAMPTLRLIAAQKSSVAIMANSVADQSSSADRNGGVVNDS